MNNFYIAITKWTKKTEDSPGYINGFTLMRALDSNDLSSSLNNLKISSNRFNQSVISNWANITKELDDLGLIYGFVSASSEDNSVFYSLSLYESEEEFLKIKNIKEELFNKIDTYRQDYANLMDLNVEIKRKTIPITDEMFFGISLKETTFKQLNDLFNSI